MKAWRFYGFNDLKLEEIAPPVCKPGHVVVKVLWVQPSVTEAQLARGIKTLAYDRIRKRLEKEAPVQLFGHEFCAEIVETGAGVSKFRMGDRVAARLKADWGVSEASCSEVAQNRLAHHQEAHRAPGKRRG